MTCTRSSGPHQEVVRFPLKIKEDEHEPLYISVAYSGNPNPLKYYYDACSKRNAPNFIIKALKLGGDHFGDYRVRYHYTVGPRVFPRDCEGEKETGRRTEGPGCRLSMSYIHC